MARRKKLSRSWTGQEISFLRRFYRVNETKWVARQLGRSVYSVRYKASALRIRKANPTVWRGKRPRPITKWRSYPQLF